MSIAAQQGGTDLQQEIAQVDWFHIMDLGKGITTPGRITCMSPEQLGIGRLDGLTVLDIGAWDGAYSFMAERRGAKRVLATDWVVWSGGWRTGNAGFKLARRVLNSKVEDLTIDVMELSPSKPGVFDIVLFLGVLYRLRHPLLALERISSVTGKQLILETHVDLADWTKPAMAFYPGSELAGDPTNWWGPNPPAVEAMLKSVGFRDVKMVSLFRPRPALVQWWSPNDPAAVKEQGRAIFHAWK
jgi:tRNA (mo5U34)-methyltransferase